MISLLLALTLTGGGQLPASPADISPNKYEATAFLTGDLAAAIPIAAAKVKLLASATTKECFDSMLSYRVHVSRAGNTISVVFRPNTRCGEGIKGGGARVDIDASSLKVINVLSFE